MRQCQHCGAMIDDDRARVCPACGQPIAPAGGDFSQKVNQTIGEIQNTPDYSNYFHPADVGQNKGISVLSYLGILLLIPLFAKKDSPYTRFHVNQGLVLFITETLYGIIVRVIRGILGGTILSPLVTILSLLDIVFLVLSIIGIVNAAGGKAKELPVIGKIRILQ
ncbi:MAG: zinc-ribbon domain-containing protein [Lachnospiraceae bacterium]|nr:zinc-ribbon domain-containing protein [Lachnospiraceae bacterium]